MSLLDSLFGSAAQGFVAQEVGAVVPGSTIQTNNTNPQQYQNQLAQQQAYNSAYQNQLAMQGIQTGRAVPGAQHDFNPNKLEAYQIPLSQLITLWQAKFGDKWVNDLEFFEMKDQFFATAADRLKANNLFEKAAGWYRLKEDA